MATNFARPPRYGGNKKRKPKLKTKIRSQGGGLGRPAPKSGPSPFANPNMTGPSGNSTVDRLRENYYKPPQQQAAPPAPLPQPQQGQPPTAAPNPQYNPSAPPPITVAGQNIRLGANVDFNNTVNQSGQALFNAALQYGDREKLRQMAADPNFAHLFAGTNVDQLDLSTGAMSQIDREQSQGRQAVDQQSNAGGTFYSGFRLQDLGEIDQASNVQRAQATADYTDALNEYYAALADAERTRRLAGDEAFNVDLEAALSRAPQATGKAITPEKPKPTKPKPEKPKQEEKPKKPKKKQKGLRAKQKGKGKIGPGARKL